MKRIVIVANGRLYKRITDEIKTDDFVIGVDRAAYWLIQKGIVPDSAIGDFDSCTSGEFESIKKNISDIQSFPPEKNFTDTELALGIALGKKPSEIVIFGGLGNRFDHTLGTAFLLEQCRKAHVKTSIRDEGNIVTLQGKGRTILEKREGYTYVSVIPISDSIIVSLKGFKYPLNQYVIARGQTIGISNEFVQKRATITLHKGHALIIQSSD